mgnify:CR=1 FL=1
MTELYDRPYSTTTFDRIGVCDICGVPLLYVAASYMQNPDGPTDLHLALSTIYEFNRRDNHVLPKPEHYANDTVRIQAIAQRYFHGGPHAKDATTVEAHEEAAG